MLMPPLPPVMVTDLRWSKGREWGVGKSGFATFDLASQSAYTDGKSIIFDISGDNSSAIALDSEVRPAATYLMPPVGHDYTISGTGAVGGTGNVWKSGRGAATVNANITTTGSVIVSEGTLNVNGTISSNLELKANGTLGGNTTVNGNVSLEGSLHQQGCRLMPVGQMTFGKSLNVDNGLVVETKISNGAAGKIVVNGKLVVKKPLTFVIAADTDDNSALAGEYILLEASQGVEADTDMLVVKGLDGHPFRIVNDGTSLRLVVDTSRPASDNVVWTGSENSIWDYTTPNFSANDAATPFVSNDKIVFDDSSDNHVVEVDGRMLQQGITVRTDNGYTFNGSGAISGTGDLVKEGKGTLYMNLSANDYTGKTVINGGTLSVSSILDAGQPCTIGNATSAPANLQINGACLEYTGTNGSTNHGITLTDSARIKVSRSNGSLALGGTIIGTNGVLVKEGPGQLSFIQTSTNAVKGVVLTQGTVSNRSLSAHTTSTQHTQHRTTRS